MLDLEFEDFLTHRIFNAQDIDTTEPGNPFKEDFGGLIYIIYFVILMREATDKVTTLFWENKVSRSQF